MQNSKLNWFPNFAIGLVILTAFAFKFYANSWKNIITQDVIGYYAYLPATIIHGDPSLEFIKDNIEEHGKHFWPRVAENGNYVIKMSMGMSFIYAPSFLLAHSYELAIGGNADGFTSPYHTGISFTAILFLFIGLFATKKLLREYFAPLTTGITILLLVFATNLFYYTYREAGMSHVYNFALIAIELLLIKKWLKQPDLKTTIYIGLLTGLISLIRPSNALIILLFFLWEVSSFGLFKKRIQFLSNNWGKVILMAISAIIVWLPQLIYWKTQTGHFFYNSYGESFFFDNFHVHEALFGYRKGWYIYTPVMFVATIGIFFMKGELKNLRFAISLFLTIFIYVTFSWWCWWYGGSFSSRPMIDIYAIMALPLASIISTGWNSKRLVKVFVVLFSSTFITLNLFQTLQYTKGVLHYDSMTKKSYWNIFGKMHPKAIYYQLLQAPDYNNAFIGNDEVFPEKTEFLNIEPNDYIYDGNNLNCNKNNEYFNLVNIVIPDTSFNTTGTIVIPKCESNTFGSDLEILVSLYSPQGEVLWFTSSNISAATMDGSETMHWDFPLNMTAYRSDSINIKVFFWSLEKSGFACKEVKVLIKGIKSYYKEI